MTGAGAPAGTTSWKRVARRGRRTASANDATGRCRGSSIRPPSRTRRRRHRPVAGRPRCLDTRLRRAAPAPGTRVPGPDADLRRRRPARPGQDARRRRLTSDGHVPSDTSPTACQGQASAGASSCAATRSAPPWTGPPLTDAFPASLAPPACAPLPWWRTTSGMKAPAATGPVAASGAVASFPAASGPPDRPRRPLPPAGREQAPPGARRGVPWRPQPPALRLGATDHALPATWPRPCPAAHAPGAAAGCAGNPPPAIPPASKPSSGRQHGPSRRSPWPTATVT